MEGGEGRARARGMRDVQGRAAGPTALRRVRLWKRKAKRFHYHHGMKIHPETSPEVEATGVWAGGVCVRLSATIVPPLQGASQPTRAEYRCNWQSYLDTGLV